MKIRRYKKVHKILNFYSNYFGFRKPYQILVDGTICFSALKNKVNIREQFTKYLEGDVKLLTTCCSVTEVENLGSELFGATLIIKQFPIHQCGHAKSPVAASKCILDMLKDNNPSRYIIATQDRQLQRKCRNIPGVPLLYLEKKTPNLEAPSEASNSVMIQKSKCQVSELDQRRLLLLDEKMAGESTTQEVFKKRKRKGGPNPLSCKKKKKKTGDSDNKPSENKRKRKRNRSHLIQKVKKELTQEVRQ